MKIKNPRLLDDADDGDSTHQRYNSTDNKLDDVIVTPNPNPKTTANLFSKLFLCWLTPFIRLGNKRELQVEDLYQVLPSDESEKLGLKLHREWTKELNKIEIVNSGISEKDKIKPFNPSLTSALGRTFGFKLGLLSLWAIFEEWLVRVAQALFLSQLIRYFDPTSGMSSTEAYLYASGVFICCVSCAFARCLCYETRHLGLQVRIALRSLIFKKCLLLSQRAIRHDTSIGHIVNLMTNDVSRFDDAMYFNYLWVSPIQVVITTTILYFILGSSCFIGLLVILLHAYFQGWSAKMFSKWRLKTADRTDKRIHTMSEIVAGIRLIKLFTWEKPFSALIDLYRKMEVSVIRRVMYFRGFSNCLCELSSKLMVFFIFVVYGLLGYHLTPEKVFLTVALFNEVRINMGNYFPNAISSTAEARVSIKRIQNFLLLDEVAKNKNTNPTDVSQSNGLVNLEKITAKWPSSTLEGNTLSNVSFTVTHGQLMAIIGQVGSGKSSLLNAILGELPLLNGSCRVRGKVAYASQEAWIFSGTIRENILCGSEYIEQKYRQVVEAAALEIDLNLLPKGDQTLVGERGISLSGGQKARVNLARCLYVDADIYLMDDPLSAVDNHVGRHVFDKAINGFLRDKTRILVTHQQQYLKDVDKILILKEGRVEAFGKSEELITTGLIDDLPSFIHPPADEQSESNAVNSNENGNGIPKEFCQSGGVTMSTYRTYLRSGGSLASLLFLATNFVIAQIVNTGIDYWLNVWTNVEYVRHSNHSTKLDSLDDPPDIRPVEMREVEVNNTFDSINKWIQEVDTYTGIYVYSILIGIAFVLTLIRSSHFFITCMSASVKLHNDMFNSVVRSPLSFFEQNPVGRILNRFSMDIGCMDDQLPSSFLDLINRTLRTLGLVVLITLMNWWLTLPAILLIISFCMIRRMFFVTSLNIRRLEGITRSPVFTHLSSSLVGLATLRAHQCESVFQQIFDQRQDVNSSAFYLTLAIARWFAIILDWTMVAYLACITYGCVALHKELTGSEAGLIISSVMFMATTFNYGVTIFVQVENLMTSTERVIEYCHLPSEAALESNKDRKPSSLWPDHGNIQFERMSLSYGENNVLNNITCHIKAKEKIGIVGRTGAGKSSLIAALFRLTEPEGKIIIDGIDTKSIGLHDLRSKISIIPQDPVLFTGTLRKNLDPFGEFDDDVLWNAMEDVKLKETMAGDMQLGLDFTVAEGGSNLSVGQRQLVCLARTIFRKNRILVLDEATANVDQMTDRLIQITVREKFNNCTVLTIAHRLDTIMDSDKVMVMDAGYLMEFDSPSNLLEDKKSIFYQLAKQDGRQHNLEFKH